MLDPYTAIGFIGALVLMVGFLMNQIGRWETSDFEYDFINLVGAAVLVVYAWQIGSYPLIVLFLIWALFSLKDVLSDGFHNILKKKGDKSSKKGVKGLEKKLDKEHDMMESENDEE